MATCYPREIPSDAPGSERRTFTALCSLESSWRVFHSVVWQSARRGRQGDGEADFVLLHPRIGLIVLEVKGGTIEIENGEWCSTDRHGIAHRIKNPFVQASESKHSLLRHIRERVPSAGNVPVSHAVVFPDLQVEEGIGVYGPRPLILDARDLRAIGPSISRVSEHWNATCNFDPATVAALVSELAPTVSVRPRLRELMQESEGHLVALTAQQIEIFRQLRRIRRVTVLGGAGTGKTILAMERARQLAQDYDTLLVCYNEPLARHMQRACADTKRLTVSTFHGLCMKAAASLGERPPNGPDEAWWERVAPDVLTAAAPSGGPRFGALVIDEGQDFADAWMTALFLLLTDPDNSPCYVFADTHQALYRSTAALPVGFAEFSLDLNCRNTLPIAERVAQIFDDPPPERGAKGTVPLFVVASDLRELADAVQSTAHGFIADEEIAPRDIAVLTNDSELRRRLRHMLVGDHAFVGFGEHGVLAESIARFKGLESRVVILAITDDVFQDSSTVNAMLYVGLSRATTLLVVIGSRRLRRALKWSDR